MLINMKDLLYSHEGKFIQYNVQVPKLNQLYIKMKKFKQNEPNYY